MEPRLCSMIVQKASNSFSFSSWSSAKPLGGSAATTAARAIVARLIDRAPGATVPGIVRSNWCSQQPHSACTEVCCTAALPVLPVNGFSIAFKWQQTSWWVGWREETERGILNLICARCPRAKCDQILSRWRSWLFLVATSCCVWTGDGEQDLKIPPHRMRGRLICL